MACVSVCHTAYAFFFRREQHQQPHQKWFNEIKLPIFAKDTHTLARTHEDIDKYPQLCNHVLDFLSWIFQQKLNLNYSMRTVYRVSLFFRSCFLPLSPPMISNIFFWEFSHTNSHGWRTKEKGRENIQFQFRLGEKFIWHVFSSSLSFLSFSSLCMITLTHTFILKKKKTSTICNLYCWFSDELSFIRFALVIGLEDSKSKRASERDREGERERRRASVCAWMSETPKDTPSDGKSVYTDKCWQPVMWKIQFDFGS